MELILTIDKILILLFIVIVGYVARKMNIVPDNAVHYFSKFLLYFTIPATILISMQIPIAMTNLGETGNVILVSLIFYAIGIAVGWFLPNILHAKKEEYGIMRYSVIFASTLFAGVPVISATFGEMGVFYASVFNIVFIVLSNTLGLWILLRKTERGAKIRLKELIIPPIIAIVIGLIIFFTSFTIPDPFAGAISFLGEISIPLSFFVIGGLLANIKIKNIFSNYRLYIISLVSLLLIPFLFKLIVDTVVTNPTILSTTIILAAMPAAVNVVLLTEEYKLKSEFAAQCVFIMTIMSLITLPIVITFLV